MNRDIVSDSVDRVQEMRRKVRQAQLKAKSEQDLVKKRQHRRKW